MHKVMYESNGLPAGGHKYGSVTHSNFSFNNYCVIALMSGYLLET